MNDITTASIVFGILAGSTLLGIRLRAILPPPHLSAEAKDSIRVAMGSVATMTALVLGLLIASTKGAYDTERSEVTQMAAKVDYLDHALTNYGSETKETRVLLRSTVEAALARIWSKESSKHEHLEPSAAWAEALPNSIQALSPQNDAQRAFKFQAMQLTSEIGQMRWLLYQQTDSAISLPLLVIVVSWLAIIFVSLGLFAPSNPTVVIALMLAVFAVAGAIFLILDLDGPFSGLIKISSAPMRNTLQHLGPP